MRSTSPSSGVRRRLGICRRAVGFFGVIGFAAVDAQVGAAGSSAAAATLSSFADFAADCCVIGTEVASFVVEGLAALADLLLLLRLIEALDAEKCAAMPRFGAMMASDGERIRLAPSFANQMKVSVERSIQPRMKTLSM